ncbi:MAG TPA: acyl-CoA thioesterase domain-containing protein [Solirubrobacteraceae bacterium]|nr:acyl-CoA thioesterase domain-containing protein [Solirubrobacteraceae bacterium]
MPVRPVFEAIDGGFLATELASGPWDPHAQIGGAPAAMPAREFERVPAPEGLVVARVTYDFIRPAPIGPVEIHTPPPPGFASRGH